MHERQAMSHEQRIMRHTSDESRATNSRLLAVWVSLLTNRVGIIPHFRTKINIKTDTNKKLFSLFFPCVYYSKRLFFVNINSYFEKGDKK
jgi:hypothetical protein